jgi:hypothetical protein
MTRARPLPPHLAGRAFSVSEAAAAGIPAHRLRAQDLRAPFRGVRVPSAAALDLAAMCRAYQTGAGEGRVVCSVTAARLWGIPLPAAHERDPRIHVLVEGDRRAPRGANVAGHTSDRAVAPALLDGVLVTPPVQTWLALSDALALIDLVVAGDRLLAWRDPLASPQEIRAAVEGYAGRRGAKRARAALAEIRAGSASPRESRCRLALVRAGLPEPELNAPIALPDGRVIHGDLVYRGARILLEYEGAHHRIDDAQWSRDIDRYNVLSAAGWIVVRVAKDLPPAAVAAAVRRAFSARGIPA